MQHSVLGVTNNDSPWSCNTVNCVCVCEHSLRSLAVYKSKGFVSPWLFCGYHGNHRCVANNRVNSIQI